MLDSSSPSVRTSLVRAALSFALLGTLALAHAEPIIGLSFNGDRLTTFDSANPGAATAVAVTGLAAGQNLIGIDLRPSTGVLYGVATGVTSSGLYTLNATTGAATLIGSLSTGLLGLGTGIGIDFNPAADLAGLPSLRITAPGSSTNLRVNVNPGFIGDTVVDGGINGAVGSLAGLAYTNNDRDPATGTMLFGIAGGNLYQVTNPNAGTTALVGGLGVGAIDGFTGFDVSGLSGTAFATLAAGTATASSFYSINLASGAATLIGAFSQGLFLADITAATPAPVVGAIPEPETYAMLMLGLASIGWVARRRRR